MLCISCGANAEKGFTTDVTDIDGRLIIIRNVPCYKCNECNEIIYTGDVIQHLEQIAEKAKELIQEIFIVDYTKAA